MKKLKDKVAVVTGGSSGIGLENVDEELINDFSEKEVKKRQAQALKLAGIKFN